MCNQKGYSACTCNHTILDAIHYVCSFLGKMAQTVASLLGKVKEWGKGMAHLLNVPFSVFQETEHLLESSTTSPREGLAGARAVPLSTPIAAALVLSILF